MMPPIPTNDDTPLYYHAVVCPDPDGLANGDGRYQAVGYRANPSTGWISAYPWTGYGMTPREALAPLERVLGERSESVVERQTLPPFLSGPCRRAAWIL